jgi:hypothetical protein
MGDGFDRRHSRSHSYHAGRFECRSGRQEAALDGRRNAHRYAVTVTRFTLCWIMGRLVAGYSFILLIILDLCKYRETFLGLAADQLGPDGMQIHPVLPPLATDRMLGHSRFTLSNLIGSELADSPQPNGFPSHRIVTPPRVLIKGILRSPPFPKGEH